MTQRSVRTRVRFPPTPLSFLEIATEQSEDSTFNNSEGEVFHVRKSPSRGAVGSDRGRAGSFGLGRQDGSFISVRSCFLLPAGRHRPQFRYLCGLAAGVFLPQLPHAPDRYGERGVHDAGAMTPPIEERVEGSIPSRPRPKNFQGGSCGSG